MLSFLVERKSWYYITFVSNFENLNGINDKFPEWLNLKTGSQSNQTQVSEFAKFGHLSLTEVSFLVFVIIPYNFPGNWNVSKK